MCLIFFFGPYIYSVSLCIHQDSKLQTKKVSLPSGAEKEFIKNCWPTHSVSRKARESDMEACAPCPGGLFWGRDHSCCFPIVGADLKPSLMAWGVVSLLPHSLNSGHLLFSPIQVSCGAPGWQIFSHMTVVSYWYFWITMILINLERIGIFTTNITLPIQEQDVFAFIEVLCPSLEFKFYSYRLGTFCV